MNVRTTQVTECDIFEVMLLLNTIFNLKKICDSRQPAHLGFAVDWICVVRKEFAFIVLHLLFKKLLDLVNNVPIVYLTQIIFLKYSVVILLSNRKWNMRFSKVFLSESTDASLGVISGIKRFPSREICTPVAFTYTKVCEIIWKHSAPSSKKKKMIRHNKVNSVLCNVRS